MTTFSLRQVRLRSGEEYRDEVEVVVEPLELGGQRYLPVPDPLPAELTPLSLVEHMLDVGACSGIGTRPKPGCGELRRDARGATGAPLTIRPW